MKNNKVNPLNLFGLRRVDTPIEHFEYITMPKKFNLEDSLCKWIEFNLKGRFYINDSLIISEDNQLETYIKVGFENPKECVYFTLACPHLKYV
jgi:hypothetical protein